MIIWLKGYERWGHGCVSPREDMDLRGKSLENIFINMFKSLMIIRVKVGEKGGLGSVIPRGRYRPKELIP